MRVLVVEDDRALAQFLQRGLMMEGHAVEWAGDGTSALRSVEQHAPDLIVLDLGLPERDGTEVLAWLREHSSDAAILVLTGRSQVQERVHCLDMGADDVLLKPFSVHELLARCRAILRRRSKFADPVLRFGALVMDRLTRKVLYCGQELELTVKEYALLEVLLRRQGESCSRAELLDEVWNGTVEGGTNIVDVYITYLRKKLAAVRPTDRSAGSAIETVRGTGYRLRSERRVNEGPSMGRRSTDVSMAPMALPRGA